MNILAFIIVLIFFGLAIPLTLAFIITVLPAMLIKSIAIVLAIFLYITLIIG